MSFQNRLRELFDYTEEYFSDGKLSFSGGLIWRFPSNRLGPSIALHGVALAGTWGERKGVMYCRVNLAGKLYYLHRLIWIYHKGDIPDDIEIDHRDLDTFNSKIGNLRDTIKPDNAKNRKSVIGSTSKYVGVSKGKRGKWRARIMLDYKEIGCGEYSTEEDAARARDRLAVRHFGEYANLNFPDDRRRYEIEDLA